MPGTRRGRRAASRRRGWRQWDGGWSARKARLQVIGHDTPLTLMNHYWWAEADMRDMFGVFGPAVDERTAPRKG